ncbi:cytochrome b [Dokdonella fugitiva]|jgi:cytochrome b561|uniref:Cytochrome b561 n=1 Tax=Dokdonella fugitiva TaxID=328517 RepID=A0A4R2IHP9_9GAMM|nr:cytochrome b [Dokdonella fugitiva]MBA8882736.1 cytochrome b561 [Dokdonella fugitiva]TCO43288.1 cytochrome b561 [Dokdonella fugitiva]
MRWKNDPHRYSSPTIALHWTMALLIVAAYASVASQALFAHDGPQRARLDAVHAFAGLCVFVTVFARLALRAGRRPAIVPPPSRLQARFALAMHVLLYAFLVAMPLLGWLLASARGTRIAFGAFELPPLVPADPALAGIAGTWHAGGAMVGYALVGGHAAAALAHHWLRRDDTLLRMLPRRRRR